MKINFKKGGELLDSFCRQRGLKHSKKRGEVLKAFLRAHRHISAYKLYELMQRKGVKVGYSTVFRTLKLLVEAGIALKIDLGKGELYFEPKLGYRHHDHLVCIKCGRVIEFLEPKIEEFQDRIAKRERFEARDHRLVIYGVCSKCRETKNG